LLRRQRYEPLVLPSWLPTLVKAVARAEDQGQEQAETAQQQQAELDQKR
jgi:hypothetical protein